MDKERMIEILGHAEDELLRLYWEIRDERGYASVAKKLDTILGKVYNLKYDIDKDKH